MKLSIVIVTYNSAEVIRGCLASIPVGWDSQNDDGRQTTDDRPPFVVHRPSSAVETIVVDNGSTDGTVEIIRSQFPTVRLFSGHGNLMFAGGNNYGFKQATAPLIFMLNPDTVVHPSALRKLVDFADAHPEAGMIAPHVLNPDGSLQHNTFHSPDLKQAFFGFFEKLVPLDSPLNGRYLPEDYARVREAEHILGATLLFRRELYDQLPGMDEKFGIYFEETDWCYRARRAGWKLLYTPDAVITHLGAHSTSKNPEKSSAQFYRSQSYFYRKNYGLLIYAALKGITAVGLLYWTARTLYSWLARKITYEKLRVRLWSYWEILKS